MVGIKKSQTENFIGLRTSRENLDKADSCKLKKGLPHLIALNVIIY